MEKELSTKQKRIRHIYYKTPSIKFELLRAMKNREVMFLDQTNPQYVSRGYFIKSIKFMEDIFKMLDFYNKNYNIYISNATYDYIPSFTLNLKNRSKKTIKWFRSEESRKSILTYDMLLDFDVNINSMSNYLRYELMSKGINQCCIILNKLDVEYNLFPSGHNWQIVIRGDWLKGLNYKDILKYTKLFSKKITLSNKFITYLDFRGIGNKEKVRKCEYSLANSKIICLPVHKASKHYEYYHFDTCFDKVDFFKRGLRIQNKNKGTCKKFINILDL